MKNKIICLFVLVFSVSFFSSAKKGKHCCATTCVRLQQNISPEVEKMSIEKDDAFDATDLPNIFLVI